MGVCGRKPLETKPQIARVALKPSMIGTAGEKMVAGARRQNHCALKITGQQ
jgi:hypothetical protein